MNGAVSRSDDAKPLVSCLCVTEARRPFMDWLLWAFDRQTWPQKELVIVDSSKEPFASERADVRVVASPPGTFLSVRRNIALQVARGSVVAWFDDDDWQHPERLTMLARAIADGADIAGASDAWLVDLFSGRCRRHTEPGGRVVFNAAGFRRELALRRMFDDREFYADSIPWRDALQFDAGASVATLAGPPLVALLCHHDNRVNTTLRWEMSERLEAFRADVGTDAWAGTEAQLELLRARVRAMPREDQGPDASGPAVVPNPTPEELAKRRAYWWTNHAPFRSPYRLH